MGGNGNSPCASCKLLRRRCTKDCAFAPYFPSDDPHKFAIVHKVFGASNISKMLQVPLSFSFSNHLYIHDFDHYQKLYTLLSRLFNDINLTFRAVNYVNLIYSFHWFKIKYSP